MQNSASVTHDIETLLHSQSLGVLATHDQGQPCTHLMAFAAVPGLKRIILATNRGTRKYANICADPRVSILVDNREKAQLDLHQAATVSASGRAAESSPEEKEDQLRIYLGKHPHLESFVLAPTSALLSVTVVKYDLVRRFQNVHELWMQP